MVHARCAIGRRVPEGNVATPLGRELRRQDDDIRRGRSAQKVVVLQPLRDDHVERCVARLLIHGLPSLVHVGLSPELDIGGDNDGAWCHLDFHVADVHALARPPRDLLLPHGLEGAHELAFNQGLVVHIRDAHDKFHHRHRGPPGLHQLNDQLGDVGRLLDDGRQGTQRHDNDTAQWDKRERAEPAHHQIAVGLLIAVRHQAAYGDKDQWPVEKVERGQQPSGDDVEIGVNTEAVDDNHQHLGVVQHGPMQGAHEVVRLPRGIEAQAGEVLQDEGHEQDTDDDTNREVLP
mmetsp:Transcript_23464/g.59936  ORF Transcript_23464/g.59936 Transcript_23464/m.59936 type:complete len:290 (-) Transcript_23464:510-1379(-)